VVPVRHDGHRGQRELERLARHRRERQRRVPRQLVGEQRRTVRVQAQRDDLQRRFGADTTHPVAASDLTTVPDGTAPALHVSGNKLVDADGANRRLLGVNRSGGEFMCVQGYGIWDGPADDASVAAIADWKANTVRIPLNEECWLGLSNIKPEYAGANYIAAVKDLVAKVEAHGMTPIVELHWTYGQYTGNSAGCSDVHATCQKPMPDAQYTPSFWSSVANTFKGDQAVAFDLFNEPYPDRATSTTTQAWSAGGTAAPAPASGTKSPVCRISSTPYGPPAPRT
jgi:endoglucanase